MIDYAPGAPERGYPLWPALDRPLLWTVVAALLAGLVVVASASVSVADQATGDAFYYLKRQAVFAVLAAGLAFALVQVPLANWQRGGRMMLLLALLLLTLVLVPGIGHEVNGAARWVSLGAFNLQVAEPVKILLALYLADYLVRRGERLRTSTVAFLVPVGVGALCAVLLLSQPDFGTALLLMALVTALLFLAGAPLWRFAALVAGLAGVAGLLIVQAPYRWERVTAFLDPWSDPFNSGFQLTQSLIAIGRGEWHGAGLGDSVQKLFYLPEAHTDFVFSVLAEEGGLLAVTAVIGLFVFIVLRAMATGWACHRHRLPFAGYVAWAVGLIIGMQAFINMGVAAGLLPTKGLTLPFFSYGGSSVAVTGALIGLLLRAGCELGHARAEGRRPEEERP